MGRRLESFIPSVALIRGTLLSREDFLFSVAFEAKKTLNTEVTETLRPAIRQPTDAGLRDLCVKAFEAEDTEKCVLVAATPRCLLKPI